MTNVYKDGVRFDPHGANRRDFLHYTRNVQELAFREGGRDNNKDAEIVLHKLCLHASARRSPLPISIVICLVVCC